MTTRPQETGARLQFLDETPWPKKCSGDGFVRAGLGVYLQAREDPNSGRDRLVEDWAGVRSDYPREKRIEQLFGEWAGRTPSAIALVSDGGEVTYEQLDRAASAVASHLRGLGVQPGSTVGVCLGRGSQLIAAMLGVLKAGAAYLPLDPSYPKERLGFILRDMGTSFAIVEKQTRGRLPDAVVPLFLDSYEDVTSSALASDPPMPGSTSVAYIMYTSGSTGQPKGVMVPHRAVVRLVRGVDYVDLGPDRTLLLHSPVSFDASTFEIWGALLNGGRLVLAPEGLPDPAQLERIIQRNGVCTLWLTASYFNLVIDALPTALNTVTQLLIGGEALSASHVRRALDLLPDTRLINGYGPTENTTFTCCYTIPRSFPDGSSVPIGRPISNTRVYVLDEDLQPVPIGQPGELYAGGDGLAVGYVNRPELDSSRFVADPFGESSTGRLYRTGDRVRWRTDGVIEYLGRFDNQIKVRGFRIEPGEVEAALERHPAIRGCVVAGVPCPSGGLQIVAWYLPAEGMSPSSANLGRFLAQTLPAYMIPSRFVVVASFPLTANGKIDRAQLSTTCPNERGADSSVELMTYLERAMASVWSDLLGVRVRRDDNFFEIGGSSLMLLRLVDRVRRELRLPIRVADVLQSPTLADLCGAIQPARRASAAECGHLQIIRAGRGVPIICLWDLLDRCPVLLDRVPPSTPIWRLQIDGMDGPCPRIRSLPEMARAMVTELRLAVPQGSITLIGFSFGGLVAYELAQQWREDGREVDVILIEPTPPGHHDWVQSELIAVDSGSWVHRCRRIVRLKRTLKLGRAMTRIVSLFANKPVLRFGAGILRKYYCLRLKMFGRRPPLEHQWWYYAPRIFSRICQYHPTWSPGVVHVVARKDWRNGEGRAWGLDQADVLTRHDSSTATKHLEVVAPAHSVPWIDLAVRLNSRARGSPIPTGSSPSTDAQAPLIPSGLAGSIPKSRIVKMGRKS